MEKSLKFPQEIETWYILPAIRREFAIEFIAAGKSQKSIAKMLDVTEAAVSQYKKQKRANMEFSENVKQKINEAVKRVLEKPESIFGEIMQIDQYIRQSGEFCRIHRSKTDTPFDCDDVCKKHYMR